MRFFMTDGVLLCHGRAKRKRIFATHGLESEASLLSPPTGESATSATHLRVTARPNALSPRQLVAVSTTDYPVDFDADVGLTLGGSRALLYVGDQQAINGLLLDPSDVHWPKSSPFQVISASKGVHDADHVEFLRRKGCLSLPSKSISHELVSSYFQHVHPFVPVIDAPQFLQDFDDFERLRTNLLVLWSVFFAAASFVDAKTVVRAGYSSRKDFKWAMYRRAKYLFDSDLEKDKVKVVQSALLLAFFYTDTQDRATAWQAWQWTGTAITLCQTMGLHRDLEAVNPKMHFRPEQICLFRRIWWSCFVCDRWLSLSHGWPMRIQLDYCDMPQPMVEDVTVGLQSLARPSVERFLSADQKALANIWVNFVRLTKAVGYIIQTFYSLQGPLPDRAAVKACEDEILLCDAGVAGDDYADSLALFHAYDLQMFREASIIALYRPYMRRKTCPTGRPEVQSLQALARTKVKGAAAQINVLLERLVDLDEVKWLKPLSLAALFPAIQIHLVEMTLATTPVLRTLSAQKFQLCMTVLSQLRDNYWGAEVAYRLFEKAQAALPQSHQTELAESENPSSGDDHENESGAVGVVLTPPCCSLLDDVPEPKSPETQQTPLIDSFADPMSFFSDEFTWGSMFNANSDAESEVNTMVGMQCDLWRIDYGFGPPDSEFTKSDVAETTANST